MSRGHGKKREEKRYKDMESKMLKQYKGMDIEKSYELNADKTIKKDSIVYTAYDCNGNWFDGSKTLSQLKRKIDNNN